MRDVSLDGLAMRLGAQAAPRPGLQASWNDREELVCPGSHAECDVPRIRF